MSPGYRPLSFFLFVCLSVFLSIYLSVFLSISSVLGKPNVVWFLPENSSGSCEQCENVAQQPSQTRKHLCLWEHVKTVPVYMLLLKGQILLRPDLK